MDATFKSALIGAAGVILGAGITGITVFLNGWLQRRWDKEKWLRERTENAYTQALDQLSFSQRKPVNYEMGDDGKLVRPQKQGEGKPYLEKTSYDGAMSSFLHVPTWMAMVEAYSSKESREKIKPFRERITRVFREVKSSEHIVLEAPNGEKVVEIGEMSPAIEDALDVVIETSGTELVKRRHLFQNLFGCSR